MSAFAMSAARQAALLPPDIYAEVTGQFRDQAREVTVAPEAEPEQEASRSRSSGGEAMGGFEGSPKPVPGDELAAAAYHREPDARTDLGMMRAAGAQMMEDERPSAEIHSLNIEQGQQRQQEATQALEASAGAQEPAQGYRPNYAALRAEQDAMAERHAQLMPDIGRDDAPAPQQGRDPEMTQERQNMLIPALIAAELAAQRPEMARSRSNDMELSM